MRCARRIPLVSGSGFAFAASASPSSKEARSLSSRLAMRLAEGHALVVRPCPVEIKHTRLSLVFHRRFEADAGHAWLRRTLMAVAREVGPVQGVGA